MKRHNQLLSIILTVVLIFSLHTSYLTPISTSANSIVPLEHKASTDDTDILTNTEYVENQIIIQMKDTYSRKELTQELTDTVSDIKIEEMISFDYCSVDFLLWI